MITACAGCGGIGISRRRKLCSVRCALRGRPKEEYYLFAQIKKRIGFIKYPFGSSKVGLVLMSTFAADHKKDPKPPTIFFFFGFWVRFERAPSLVSFVVVGGKTTRPTDTKEGEKDPSLGIHPLRPWTTIIKPRMTDARRRKVFMEYSLESTQDTHRQIWSLNTKRHCVWNREE